MSWTAPRTWIAAETLTAALLNTHVRDNLLETAVAKVTTKGDLAVATGANALTRLAVGTNGAVLVADSAATPGVRWSSTAITAAAGLAININISNSVLTAAANSDILISVDNGATYATGTKTGLTAYGIYAPGGNMTKTGTGTIDVAYNLYLSAPAIATTNWTLYCNNGNSRLGDTSSKVFIGDTSNANMTSGLTLLSTASDERLCIKDSGVAHGVTTLTETDSVGVFSLVTTGGGLSVDGYAANFGGLPRPGVKIRGTATTADTARSVNARAAVEVDCRLASGTGVASIGANSNLVAFFDNGAARFVFDSDGDSHEDGTGWTAYDDFDDLALLNALDHSLDKRLSAQAGAWLRKNKAALQAARIVTFNDDADGAPFINKSRLGMLLVGAVRQLGATIQELRAELADNHARLAALEMRLIP